MDPSGSFGLSATEVSETSNATATKEETYRFNKKFDEYYDDLTRIEQSKKKNQKLYNWSPRFGVEEGHYLCWYVGEMELNRKQWHTHVIKKRVSERVFQTTSGAFYELYGESAIPNELSEQIPYELKQFCDGVPAEWEILLARHSLNKTNHGDNSPFRSISDDAKEQMVQVDEHSKESALIVSSDSEDEKHKSPVGAIRVNNSVVKRNEHDNKKKKNRHSELHVYQNSTPKVNASKNHQNKIKSKDHKTSGTKRRRISFGNEESNIVTSMPRIEDMTADEIPKKRFRSSKSKSRQTTV